jgi:hypothetical protein
VTAAVETCKCGVAEDEHGWGDPPHSFVPQSYDHEAPTDPSTPTSTPPETEETD